MPFSAARRTINATDQSVERRSSGALSAWAGSDLAG